MRITAARVFACLTLAAIVSACGGGSGSTLAGGGGGTPGTLALGAASYTVAQPAATVAVSVARTGGSSGAVSIQYATANGTAVAGTDYTATSGTLNWADGDAASKTINIPVGTTPFSGTRSFSVTLATPTGSATLGSPAAATVSITGNGVVAAPGTLALGAATYAVAQPTATVALTATRTGGSSGAVTVQYATANGTAVAGTDYTAANGTLSWASGDAAAKTINVTIGTTAFNGTKAFTLAISAPTGSATLGTPATATVTITGSGAAAPGTLAMASANVGVVQSAGTVALTVNRAGGTSGAVSIQYLTANGSATAGTHYTAASGTLNWAAGDAAAKIINVMINTTAFTGSKTFTVMLSTPGGGATLGTPASTTVSITGTGGGTGTTTHVPFKLLPTWAGGPGTEWVNGETRFVKDNNPAGSGELFGFVWSDSSSNMNLLVSSDNGASWRIASTGPSNGCGSNCPNHIIATTQDSTGKVHCIGWTNTADAGHYLRMTLTYANSQINGFSLDTPGGLALPTHPRSGTELRADIKMITDAMGAETVAYAVNMSTFKCTYDCDIKVYMGRATSLAPTSTSQIVNLAGGPGDTLVFDSCAVSACSTYGFSSHVHTALFAQNATSHDLYLFQGPIDGDYGLAYADPTFNTVYMRRLTSGGGGWTIGALSTISSTVQATVSPELMSVASGTGYAWLMYVDPAKGVTFGRVDTAGSYSEGAVTSPDTTINRNGWGVFSVSADDTKVWAIWDTLAPISGGSARAGEGYWNGSAWTQFTDPGASDSMGMAGISGWKSGTAAILFNGNVLAQTYQQPTAASIQTQ